MYLDSSYTQSDYAFVNSDSLSFYQMEYSDGISDSSHISRYAYVAAGNAVTIYTKDRFKIHNSQILPYCDVIDQIFSTHPELLAKDPNSEFPYIPPYFIDVRSSSSSSISMEDFSKVYNKSLQSTPPTSSYPIATRYISSDGTIFVERPPFQATVDYKPAGASSSKKKLPPKTIWIPWTLYCFNPNYPGATSYMYFSHKSLTSMSDNYYPTFLPNTYTDGRICYSNSLSSLPLNLETANPASVYSYMINEFFAGSWNADLMNPWVYLHSSIYPLVSKKDSQQIFSTIPHLSKLFFPDSETIEKSGLDKISKINSFYLKYGSKAFFASLPSEHFHYSLLSIISTFSLPEVLSLQEEIDFINQDISLNKDASVYYANQHKLFRPFTFKDISSLFSRQINNSLNSYFIRDIISKVSVDNMVFSDYTSSHKNIIFANFPHHNTPMFQVKFLMKHSISLKINQAILSAQDSAVVIFDSSTQDIYHAVPSPGTTIDQMYIEMLRAYAQNNYYFPFTSTSSYQILSKDDYVKL